MFLLSDISIDFMGIPYATMRVFLRDHPGLKNQLKKEKIPINSRRTSFHYRWMWTIPDLQSFISSWINTSKSIYKKLFKSMKILESNPCKDFSLLRLDDTYVLAYKNNTYRVLIYESPINEAVLQVPSPSYDEDLYKRSNIEFLNILSEIVEKIIIEYINKNKGELKNGTDSEE